MSGEPELAINYEMNIEGFNKLIMIIINISQHPIIWAIWKYLYLNPLYVYEG